MVSVSTQFDFAAELLAMLVASCGLVLVTLRADITQKALARPCFALGFVLLGADAYADGTHLSAGGDGLLTGARAVGALCVGLAAIGWASGPRSRNVLLSGVVLTAVASAVEATTGGHTAVDVLVVTGSVAIGAALLGAARRSIAVRIAANAAATLLLVVLVLSVALSSVIATSVQHEELLQFRTRVAVEAAQLTTTADDTLEGARLVAADLDAFAVGEPASVLEGRTGAGRLRERVTMAASFYPVGSIGYLPAQAAPVGARTGLTGPVGALPVAARLLCTTGAPGAQGRADLAVVASRALAVGAFPVCATGRAPPLGTVVVATSFDRSFLAGIRRADPGLSLSLVAGGSVLSSVGDGIGPTAVGDAALAGPVARGAMARLDGGRFVVVVPVDSLVTRAPVLSLVASLPISSVGATQESLVRTLFVIALGGTVLALCLAALTGDRITAGLRRLTLVAQGIQEGRISQRVGAISRDEVGSLAGAFDAMVTSVEEKNAALRDAADGETRLRNRLEAVVDGMSDALVAVDATGRITDFNRAAEQLTGIPAPVAAGRDVVDVVTLAGDHARDLAERVHHTDPAPWGVLALLHHEGEAGEVPVAVSCGAVRGPAGELVGSVLVLRDLRREQELERMKSEFMSRVGHELRTPLTGILGYADILVHRDVPPARAREWHGEILAAAKRQLRIVQLLEFFASSGGGRLVLRPQPTEVRPLVQAAAGSWDERLPPGVTLTVRMATRIPDVMADRRWLTLAIDELIDNAAKFSPADGTVAVRSGPAEGGGTEVLISVSDRGRGMDADEQVRAFGEFEQGDASDTRSFGGLGLGLPAVVRVVAGHGGRLECRSAPGRGTTMTIRLPVPTTATPTGAEPTVP